MKGKHADKMVQMLERSSNKEETFMKQMHDMLETNKKKYDQNLQTDWFCRVYADCAQMCIKKDEAAHSISELRDVEKICSKMCIRKHYRAYKLYESLEGKIFKAFVDDNNIDYEAM